MTKVSVDNLWIEFPVYDVSARSIRNKLFRRAAGGNLSYSQSHVVVTALRELSFQFVEGDRVAVIGPNGAGKSTLLRALAGVYPPTQGTVHVDGRVSPMFNISLGMQLDATGYENIKICGMLWGMSAEEIREKMPSISEFTGLGDYLSMPIRTYSAGMAARLAFSIATAVDPDILLLDEVIGAGDSHFNKKAFKRIKDMAEKSSILFMALHAMDVLRTLCNKAVWLQSGVLMGVGDFADIVSQREKFELEFSGREETF